MSNVARSDEPKVNQAQSSNQNQRPKLRNIGSMIPNLNDSPSPPPSPARGEGEKCSFQANHMDTDRSPKTFHFSGCSKMPGYKAPEVLRVASRRIRSDILPRRRVGESARGVLCRTLQQACPVLDTGKDEGNPQNLGTHGCFSAA
jgi:hypothetical protein